MTIHHLKWYNLLKLYIKEVLILKNYINLEDMANQNGANVLNVIQKNANISRRQITELTGLSWGGMTKIVNKLLENEYIIEKKQTSGTKSGRIPSIISVNTNRNFVIGLDINKTGLKAIVLNLSGEILKEFSSGVSLITKSALTDDIISFIQKIFDAFDKDKIIAIGIALQGIVDSKDGISEKFPGISDWDNVPIKSILQEKFKVNVFIEHDPDCILYPHIKNTNENLMLLRVDKSIGMAVSINGKILKSRGILEVAHNTIVPGGKLCSCGERGCMEAYISPCLENGKINTSAFYEFVPVFSILIKNLTKLFNIDKIILAGDLIKNNQLLEDNLIKELKKINCTKNIFFSSDNDNAVLGAALIAINKSINSMVI